MFTAGVLGGGLAFRLAVLATARERWHLETLLLSTGLRVIRSLNQTSKNAHSLVRYIDDATQQ